MTGLIWLVQLVHYPSFAWIDRQKFTVFHHFHSSRVTWIVGPVMGAELITAGLWFFEKSGPLTAVNLVSVLALWILTGAWAVPLHNRLAQGFEPLTHRRLLRANAWRTGLWSARLLALALLL